MFADWDRTIWQGFEPNFAEGLRQTQTAIRQALVVRVQTMRIDFAEERNGREGSHKYWTN
jgi:hypothetical protein